MRERVEDAGPALSAAGLKQQMIATRRRAGTCRVGWATVAWRFHRPDTVAVAHSRGGLLAALAGAAAEPVGYELRVLKTRNRGGGRRWWWACPGGGRRCEALYLSWGRDRLACRTCCRLVYESQYRPRAWRRQ
jgi:hypothetical protein